MVLIDVAVLNDLLGHLGGVSYCKAATDYKGCGKAARRKSDDLTLTVGRRSQEKKGKRKQRWATRNMIETALAQVYVDPRMLSKPDLLRSIQSLEAKIPAFPFAALQARIKRNHLSDILSRAIQLSSAMQTSSYLERALFHDQTSANHEYFESKAEQLFAQPEERSYVELYVQRPSSNRSKSSLDSDHTLKVVQKRAADANFLPESPMDSWYRVDSSSRTQIERWRISDVQEFKYYATVRSNSC